MLHRGIGQQNPFKILTNIIEYLLIRNHRVGFILSDEDYEKLTKLLITPSNATGITVVLVHFETANILAIPYPSESYDTKIYISNEVQAGCNISWYRL